MIVTITACVNKRRIYMVKDDKIQQVMRDLQQQPADVGEDGAMICVANDEKDAVNKFVKHVHDLCGDSEDVSYITEDNIIIAFLFMVDPENEEHEDYVDSNVEWFVSKRDKSPYPVYMLSV